MKCNWVFCNCNRGELSSLGNMCYELFNVKGNFKKF